MESAAVLATPAFQNFDKGLRARSLGDQLSAIVAATTLLKENPFPNLVNQVAVRLSEAFRDGNNRVRTCVVRVLADSSEHLSLIFSSEEVLKRIFSVSHSNDPNSRALTLEVLGRLAHLYVDCKKVHHLILESLTAESDFEFECATHAMTAFAKISTEFSQATVERIAVLLTSSDISIQRKALMIPTIGTMKSDVHATKECFSLERCLLDSSSNSSLVCALLSAMTSLAQSTRYTIPEQTEILLIAAIASDSCLPARLTALSELIKMAEHSYAWEDAHLKKMRELKKKVEASAPMTMSNYLRILVELSSRIRPNHAAFLQETLVDLSYLFTAQQISQRILSIQFACNVYISHPGDTLAVKLVHAFTITAGAELKPREAKRFYATLAQFLCSPSLSEEYVSTLIGPFLESSPSHPHGEHILQLFCRVADRLPYVVSAVNNWAKKHIGGLTNPELFKLQRHEPFVFLLLSPTTVSPTIFIDPSEDWVAAGSDWDKYTTARTAFRNGHWRTVAAANLGAIDTSVLSATQKLWIEVLHKIAWSQLPTFTAAALKEQRETLLFAQAKSVELVEFLPDPAFLFTRSLVHAQLTLSSTLSSFFCGVDHIIRFDCGLKDPTCLNRVRAALQRFVTGLQKCDLAWTDLYRKAFSADESTLDYLSFIHTSIILVLTGVKHLLNDRNVRDIMMPNLLKETTIAVSGRKLLEWTKGQVEQLGVFDGNSFDAWKRVVEALFTFRQAFPRYIFHQEYQFEIKLNVSSAINGEMTVAANQNVPIQIDGFIQTNHPAKIDSVIITAGIHYYTAFGNNTSITSAIKLNGDTHFSSQLMLTFRQSCNIEFSIEFVDAQKRTWSSSVRSKVKVNINE